MSIRGEIRSAAALLLVAALGMLSPARADSTAAVEHSAEADRIQRALLKVKTVALPEARTSPFLGKTREGTGIVIDREDHVLTIGYVILEADSIELTTSDGRTVPAVAIGYDHASGFGVVKASVPLGVEPIALGSSGALTVRDPVMVLGYGGRDSVHFAHVVSRREFVGSWEYLLDSAIYTLPPMGKWSGAALLDRGGRLVGVGSLLVRDAMNSEPALPGNLFVPIDLLKPILPELLAAGRTRSARPWLGLTAEEFRGRLFVVRVAPEGPAERAGIEAGDIVIGVGGESVAGLLDLYRKIWRMGDAGVEVPLQVLSGANAREVRVPSINRLDYLRVRAVH